MWKYIYVANVYAALHSMVALLWPQSSSLASLNLPVRASALSILAVVLGSWPIMPSSKEMPENMPPFGGVGTNRDEPDVSLNSPLCQATRPRLIVVMTCTD
jgi:hypothetical protein